MLHILEVALPNSWLAVLLTALIAYLLGSISTAVIVSRCFFREDVREKGSGNAGATNDLRNYGKKAALITTVGDLLKSIVAVLVGGFILTHLQLTGTSEISMDGLRIVGRYLAGACCVLGHLFPIFFGFRGGKGVMASFGMILILDYRIALLCLLVFLVTVAVSRTVSLGSVLGEFVAPCLGYFFGTYVDKTSMETTLFCTLMIAVVALSVIVKHRSNIARICRGNENKLHLKK